MENVRDRLSRARIPFEENVPLKRCTTMGVGGPARFLVQPRTVAEATAALQLLGESTLPVLPLGKGANVIFSDRGFHGAVLRLRGIFEQVWIQGSRVISGSGVLLHHLVRRVVDAGLGGMDRLAGFPSSVGGAVRMNAGCYGQEIGYTLFKVILMTQEGNLRGLYRTAMEMSYRTSSLHPRHLVAFAVFHLERDDRGRLESSMNEVIRRRVASLPPGRHCGSIFKNPQGKKAWELIRQAGLAGRRVGGAEVSTRHANVILNRGEATAADIHILIVEIQERIRERFGIDLEPEVKLIGFTG